MSASTLILQDDEIDEYDRFVRSSTTGLIYHTKEFLLFLSKILDDAVLKIFVVRRNGAIIGAIPCFLKWSHLGAVLNSLPYFGSHGDAIVSDGEYDTLEISSRLLEAAMNFCRDNRIGAVNIVAHPLRSNISRVGPRYGLTTWSSRIGQISSLPHAQTRETADKSILQSCSGKTRNLVRKGLRAGFEVKVSNLESDWSELAKHHSTSMSRIGGIAKSLNQFLALKDTLSPNNMCRLYVAYRGAEFAGALLNLYYEEWVEYFAPVSVERFRGEQVMSALIATAMSDAILEGRRYWNWGGTWLTQSGVYRFKKGWGAKDHLYAYCGAVFDKELEKRQSSELLAAFPLFFVRPFDLVGAVSK